jgi:pyruvate-formate lyase-activating enzyme
MIPEKSEMFRFPWSKTDNPGAWIEVTDICNFNCPGCFRKNNFEGHKPLDVIKSEVIQCKKMTNCSRICISGGEPLMHPDIVEIVKFISDQKLKPIMLSNGEFLDFDMAKNLGKAGLFQFYLHADSGQNRHGWINKTENDMNELRQYYADLVHKVGGIKCGFNLTIRHSNLNQVQDIVSWYRKNIDKVSHLSLIAFRGIPEFKNINLRTEEQKGLRDALPDNIKQAEEINISSVDILNRLSFYFNDLLPSAYLPGTFVVDTYKLLTINLVGSKKSIYGSIGKKSIEIHQLTNHLFRKKYDATVPDTGRIIFFLSIVDKALRKAFKNYVISILKSPLNLFKRVYIQSIVIQQPFEVIDGEVNLCDGCVNQMPYKGKMINSCRLEEYRLFSGPLSFK